MLLASIRTWGGVCQGAEGLGLPSTQQHSLQKPPPVPRACKARSKLCRAPATESATTHHVLLHLKHRGQLRVGQLHDHAVLQATLAARGRGGGQGLIYCFPASQAPWPVHVGQLQNHAVLQATLAAGGDRRGTRIILMLSCISSTVASCVLASSTNYALLQAT